MNKPTASAAYGSFGEYFGAMRELMARYDALPADNLYAAWSRATASVAANPWMQNNRVKRISTFPRDMTKETIAEATRNPDESEKTLRAAAHGLEWTAFPFRKIRTTYQAVNTDRYYHYPAYLTAETAKEKTVMREGVLLDKLNHMMQPGALAHQIRGQCVQEGKVFYQPRYSVDKSHNAVKYAYAQQIPSDYVKIVGFNSESKYTVMFDMTYLLTVPGADWRQFGDLLLPYLEDFSQVFVPVESTDKIAFSSLNSVCQPSGRRLFVDLERFDKLRANAEGDPKLWNRNGRWAYWVTLPPEKVWPFEIDDTTRTVAPMTSGLFISFAQIADVENIALSVMQNPLVSICLGELETFNDRQADNGEVIKLSPTARDYFLMQWFNMLASANATGISFFGAPMRNLHMETLPSVTGSSDMTTKEYGYAILKSGMSGLIPINSDPRAGSVEIAAKLEERMCRPIYDQMERMMESIYRQIGTKHEWRFRMFGGFVSDAQDLENCRKGMQSGILSETMKYLALRGISFWDDLGISNFVAASGILNLRIPMVTSYSANQEKSGLPPRPQDPDNTGGRPEKGIEDALAEGGEQQESDLDRGD